MTTTRPIVEDQVNVITLKNAKKWHNAFKDQNNKGFAPGDIPPSIVIPFADIEQIVTDFRDTVQKTVNGVRVYFIIKPQKKANGKVNISCICVPTTGPFLNEQDVDPNKRFTDMVIKATLRDDASRNADRTDGTDDTDRSTRLAVTIDDSDAGYVSVYDLTRPCPPFCDPESPINDEEVE